MKETIDPIAVAIDVFNTELAKTDLSDFQKAVVRDCFALGLASGLCLELRRMIR